MAAQLGDAPRGDRGVVLDEDGDAGALEQTKPTTPPSALRRGAAIGMRRARASRRMRSGAWSGAKGMRWTAAS
jgi:hypothetical protein